MAEATMTDSREREELAAELARYNITVHRPGDPPLFTREPRPAMRPAHWRAADIARLLEKLGEHLKLEAGGQRRTLRLTNPGLPWGTTPTFWASIQYILPGEIAGPHRHAASALRFVMEGNGTDTIVDGEQFEMHEGDLVLTPSWTFHDHEHKGDRPMVWLDVLDISLVRALDGVFFEALEAERQKPAAIADRSFRQYGSGIMRPADPAHRGKTSPVLAYARDRAEAALLAASGLDPDPCYDTLLEYQNPLTGGPALPTIGTALQRLRPGFRGAPLRQTGSAVHYVVRGEGTTVIEGERFDWGRGDFIALPSWAQHEIANRSASDEAVLFHVNDHPVLKALGLWREARP
ncbi:MAG TPA: cupin domain-containing protein [Candidatus Elarobacter sp.]|jgi:gentisate 1,2-dioxygenase